MFTLLRSLLVATIFIASCRMQAQDIPDADITIDFNDHTFEEKRRKIITKPVGVSLVDDRFGNERSALYLHGTPSSYLNLSASPALKSKSATISLWVKLDRKVFAGKGYESNPILIAKNSSWPDFYDAYTLFYDLKSNRFIVFSTYDTTGRQTAGVNSIDTVIFNKWYNLTFTYDNNYMEFYVDGQLQERSKKNYETQFDALDSVMVGNGASWKNDRWMRGVVDDIRFYHRVLSEQEIKALYNESNPNKTRNLVNKLGIYTLFILLTAAILLFIIWRYKKIIQQQKEQFELRNRVNELEMRVIKAQMNPHFISNCLAAIQELIYNGQVEKAGQYIAKFSFFLRKALAYSDQTYISLKEETEIIKLNVELEQLRFKNSFDFEMQVAPAITPEKIIVPSLICQPFIENAIWHGLIPLRGLRRPRLSINIHANGLLFIEIEDNGVGRNNAELKNGRISKGTQLARDKLESINKITNTTIHKLEIQDLKDNQQKPCGTRIIIQLLNHAE